VRPAPPPILGFAFYVLATGCVALGIAQLATFIEKARVAEVAPLPWWSLLVGEAMVLTGLVIAWRAAKGTSRRLLAVAAALWATLFVLQMQSERVAGYMVGRTPGALFMTTTASSVGRAIVLLLVAVVVHRSGRAFATRTWTATAGALLVFADAWVAAWPLVTRSGIRTSIGVVTYASPSMVAGGVGALLVAGGLYAAGRAVLGGASVVAPEAEGLRGALPLFVEGIIAVAALALAHAACVAAASHVGLSAYDVSETTTIGGELLAWVVLAIALRRMGPQTSQAFRLLLAVCGALVLEIALRYALWSRGVVSGVGSAPIADAASLVAGLRILLSIRALHFAVVGLAGLPERPAGARTALRGRARVATNLLGASLVASLFAPGTSEVWFLFLEGLAVVSGAIALYAAIAASREAQRIEIQPIR